MVALLSPVRCCVCQQVWTRTPDLKLWWRGYTVCPRQLWDEKHEAFAANILRGAA